MGKSGDLWDDNALINAFDHAMATYETMHSKTYHADRPEEEKHTSGDNENNHGSIDKATGHTESERNSGILFNNAMETHVTGYNTEETTEGIPIQENNLVTDLNTSESQTKPSGLPCTDEKTNSYADQPSMDYDQLLRQYYEIEEQKQKVVEQLHQAGYLSIQTPGQCSTCQVEQLHQASYSNVQTPVQCSTCQVVQAPTLGAYGACLLCSCCCLGAPLFPMPACTNSGLSSGGCGGCQVFAACCPVSDTHRHPRSRQTPSETGTCSIGTSCMLDHKKQSLQNDENTVKIGTMAAEKAISCMRMGISASSNICDGKEKEADKEDGSGLYKGKGPEGISSESDLVAVLSAWYAAGFHTGRYLSEQSKRK